MHEHFFTCPHCWQTISMLLDLSAEVQAYVEDCEVCCNPLHVSFRVEEGAVADFEVQPLEQ